MRLLSKDLHLVSPNTSSPASEIREVQRMLGTAQDGVYGPITASAVKAWKYRFGFHKNYVTTSLTRAESQWLFGSAKQTANMKIRAAARKPKPTQLTTGPAALKVMQEWASKGYNETRTNYVPELSRLAKDLGLSTQYQAMGWSWCAFATGLSGLAVGSKTYKDFFAGAFNSKLQLYVPQIWYYARNNMHGFRAIGWEQAEPGDLVIYNWDGGVPDHIGRLVARKSSTQILAVEGNTSPGSTGSQSNGDGVYMKIRQRGSIYGFVREA